MHWAVEEGGHAVEMAAPPPSPHIVGQTAAMQEEKVPPLPPAAPAGPLLSFSGMDASRRSDLSASPSRRAHRRGPRKLLPAFSRPPDPNLPPGVAPVVEFLSLFCSAAAVALTLLATGLPLRGTTRAEEDKIRQAIWYYALW